VLDINEERLDAVVGAAFDATGETRWRTAIVKAARALKENPYISEQGGALLILSDSGEIYSANGVCQCNAYEKGFPCWHRAAARLMRRYNETSH
jgi:hypothetical protein